MEAAIAMKQKERREMRKAAKEAQRELDDFAVQVRRPGLLNGP